MTTMLTAQQIGALDDVLEELKRPATTAGRLIFGIDATASRQPTWDAAAQVQGAMFEAVAELGRLETKLVFYRGYDECKASRWVTTAADLHTLMRTVSCAGGETQIERVMAYAIAETGKQRVHAMAFVGDAVEENFDRLCKLASERGRLGTPVFVFHEGGDACAGSAFRQIAELSGGAYLPFSISSIAVLKALLAGVAIYATAGRQALEDYAAKQGGEVRQLTAQLEVTRP